MPAVRLAYSVILVAVLLGVPAAAGWAADETVLRRGNASEPESLDPARSDTLTVSHIHDDLFEGLTTLDADDRPQPAAAASWQISADGLVYTVKLRPGLRWSDGSPLTAADFVYSLRRVVDPVTASTYAFLLFPIKNARAIVNGTIKDLTKLGVEALDATTIRFTLVRPTPYFLAVLAHDKFMPVQRASVEKYGASFTQPGHLVSNGAYQLQEWTPQSRIVVVRNPYFHDAAKVRVDKVIFYPIQSPTEEVNRYRAGELDVTYSVPVNQMEALRQSYPSELESRPEFSMSWWGFNLTRPPFANNPKLRQAMAMVIDRELIRDKITHTGSPIAYGVVPAVGDPDYTAQTAGWSSLTMVERIAKAKELYREAGYGPDHPLAVEVRMNTDENSRKVMIAMAAMWQTTLGIKTVTIPEEFKTLVADRHQKEVTQLFQDAWIGDYPDATTFLDLYTAASGENDGGYSNPAYDALIAEAENVADVKRRAELLAKAESLLLADSPLIPMYVTVNWHLIKPYVQGFHEDPCGHVYSKDVALLPHA